MSTKTEVHGVEVSGATMDVRPWFYSTSQPLNFLSSLLIKECVGIDVFCEDVRHPFPVYASLEKILYMRKDAEDRYVQIFPQNVRICLSR